VQEQRYFLFLGVALPVLWTMFLSSSSLLARSNRDLAMISSFRNF
jgi:hypothetical protein